MKAVGYIHQRVKKCGDYLKIDVTTYSVIGIEIHEYCRLHTDAATLQPNQKGYHYEKRA